MLAWFLEEIGVASAHIVGVSAGGWVALELGKTPRARSVTAICPGGFWRGRMPLYVRVSLRVVRIFTRAFRRVIPAIASSGVGRAMLLWQVTAKPWRMNRGQAVEFCGSFADCCGFAPVLRANVYGRFTGGADVRVPVTIAQGDRDRLMLRRQSQHWDEAPSQARFVSLAGCGHVPLWDDPDRIVAVILEGSETAAPHAST
jgi:pimeloyl-ACP methyl ester carboxylesterase